MKILNLHGYNGSPKNAAYAALQANCCKNIMSPELDYDADSPENILGKLRVIIADEQIDILIGTSLGGFFVAVLSAELNIPVILINPCLMPFLHLPRLGFEGDIKPFISQFGTLIHLNRDIVSCIVGEDDEVIDTHDLTERIRGNSRFRRIPGGKHSGATLPLKEYFGEILHYYTDILSKK